jgi:teichuronic acid biosynthesis glycosyltransferase TuaC
LIVCSGNVNNFDFILHHSFIYEQINSVKHSYNIDYDTYFIKGKGFIGYLKNLQKLKNKIREYSPDIVHAHFGLSGLVSCLQRITPVIVTFHGSDANSYVKFLSKVTAHLAIFSIYVEQKISKKINVNKKNAIIPCGLELDKFFPIERKVARDKLNLVQDQNYILFSSAFNNPVKNYNLAKKGIELLKNEFSVIELKNRTREEVNLLINACNLLILTSISEGSPQIIKEAMACNCPIVSTDVGDIRELIGNTEGCYLTSFEPEDVANKIKLALKFGKRTNGRERIKHLDNKIIAKKIMDVYKTVLK